MFFWIRRLISRAFSGPLHENLFRRPFEILEEGRTQPSFHFPLWPAIPITSVFGSSPNESGGVAWKGACREDDSESVCGVWDVFCQYIQNVVGPADERFPHEAGNCVVEYPYSFQPVGENDRQGVNFLPVAASLARMQLICWPTPTLSFCKVGVLTICPDYSDRPSPDFLALFLSHPQGWHVLSDEQNFGRL